MGVQVEFNPDLALRNISEFKNGNRKIEECIPENLTAGKIYEFLKEGQRNYWLQGELPLRETEGNQQLSRPIASIKIIEATHTLMKGRVCTKGKYKVLEVFGPTDSKIHFESYKKIE